MKGDIEMDIRGKKINFLGDSITEGVGVTDISRVYWNLLAENSGCISRGYGISGTRIARQQKPDGEPHDDYFALRIPKMDADADVVVIFGGTNDYGHGDAAMGKMSDRTDDTFYGALHNLYTGIIKKYPKAQFVVMTPTHRVEESRVYNNWGVRNVGSLEDYVNVISEVASYYKIPVLDLFRASGIEPEDEANRNMYAPDGLHPSDAGHVLIYKALSEFLKKL